MADERKSWWTRTKELFSYDETFPLEAFSDTGVAIDVPTSTTGSFVPPARANLPHVDPRTALTINAVYAAVRLLSTSVSQLPLQVMRNGREVKSQPTIIRQPDPNVSLTNFLILCVNHMALWGNAYLRLIRDVDSPDGTILAVRILNPELVYVTIGDHGQKIYQYTDEILQEWQVYNLMLMPEFDPATQILRGKSPVQKLTADLQNALDLNAYMSAFFTNNGIPAGILTTDGYLGEGESDLIRDRWYEVDAVSGLQVLPNGLTYQQISLSPQDLQFHASANKIVCDVARVFGIPDRYLLAAIEHTSMSYQNMLDADRQLVTYGLMAFIQQIEDALSFLLPRGQSVVMNLDAFLRGSPMNRYQALALADFMTVNEKRAISGLDPITGGDKLTAPAPKPLPAPAPAPAANPNSNEGDSPTN